MFVSFACLFLSRLLRCSVSFSFAWENLSWESSISRVTRWLRGKGEGLYPSGGVGYLRLTRLCHLAARAPPEARVESYLVYLRRDFFAKKWDHFLRRIPPVVAPKGDLIFGGKPSRPFTLLIDGILHLYNQLECWVCK
jgi:hypothetical protein